MTRPLTHEIAIEMAGMVPVPLQVSVVREELEKRLGAIGENDFLVALALLQDEGHVLPVTVKDGFGAPPGRYVALSVKGRMAAEKAVAEVVA